MKNSSYDSFIESKIKDVAFSGFDPKKIKTALFDWQKYVVEWAIKKGKCALKDVAATRMGGSGMPS